MLVVIKVFYNNLFYDVIFWSTLHISIQKCKAFFLLHVFGILTFFNVCYHSWKRSHGNLFYFKYAYLKEHISASEKIQSFEHRVILPLKHCIRRKSLNFGQLYLLISWCLICRMTTWIKFVSTKEEFPKYLLSNMWSFGHQCIFQSENARKLHFLWFWGMISTGANEITCSF